MRREAALPAIGNPERMVEYQKEQRKSRRFAFRQSAIVRSNRSASHEVNAETENASLYGALLRVAAAIPDASEVEVELRLSRDGTRGVWLRGAGRVVRSEIRPAGDFGIAVAFDQPLSERSHAPAAMAKLVGQ